MWFLVEISGHYIEYSQSKFFVWFSTILFLQNTIHKYIQGFFLSKIRHMNSMEQKGIFLVKLMSIHFRIHENLIQFLARDF